MAVRRWIAFCARLLPKCRIFNVKTRANAVVGLCFVGIRAHIWACMSLARLRAGGIGAHILFGFRLYRMSIFRLVSIGEFSLRVFSRFRLSDLIRVRISGIRRIGRVRIARRELFVKV